MKKDKLIQDLEERRLIAQISNRNQLLSSLRKGPISLYCGFDPTSDSLHLGHLLLLLCLKRFQLSGNNLVVLIGGATGMIGDPSFKKKERILNSFDTVQNWTEKIKNQISKFFSIEKKDKICIVNNYDWLHNIDILTFLRNIGKYFSVNQLINKESIKQRIDTTNNGISFTEFSYNILQSYDFACLYKTHNVTLQVGGSDQWGNISSGINLTRRLYKKTVFGLTTPLITRSDGIKFGKTEHDTIWLDSKKTSPYQFYQFWINVSDKDVYQFLRFFTFIDKKEIDELEQSNHTNQNKKKPQLILAEEVTRIVHGAHGLSVAKRISDSLFYKHPSSLQEKDFSNLIKDGILCLNVDRNISLLQVLLMSKLVTSKNQARSMITSSSISVNGEKRNSLKYIFSKSDKLHGRFTLIKKGKKNHFLLIWK